MYRDLKFTYGLDIRPPPCSRSCRSTLYMYRRYRSNLHTNRGGACVDTCKRLQCGAPQALRRYLGSPIYHANGLEALHKAEPRQLVVLNFTLQAVDIKAYFIGASFPQTREYYRHAPDCKAAQLFLKRHYTHQKQCTKRYSFTHVLPFVFS